MSASSSVQSVAVVEIIVINVRAGRCSRYEVRQVGRDAKSIADMKKKSVRVSVNR